MREEPLFSAALPLPVRSLAELYAIAFEQARKAAQDYLSTAAQMNDRFSPSRSVFEVLASHERDHSDRLVVDCLAACGKRPDIHELRWAPAELMPTADILAVGNSSLSTPYTAWALAVRYGQRAFVFWTYVIAVTEDPTVRRVAESFAHGALSDCNRLRIERRLAWRAERRAELEHAARDHEPSSAALLESLLLKDIVAWSPNITPAQRGQLLNSNFSTMPEVTTLPGASKHDDSHLGADKIEQLRCDALRRAEKLVNIYLDDADRATTQSSMELAQKLASQSIIRLAKLRHL